MASRRNAAESLRSGASLPMRQFPAQLPKGMSASEINWDAWSRHIESKRRRLGKLESTIQPFSLRAYLAEATYISFRLDGLDVTEAQVQDALATGTDRRT